MQPKLATGRVPKEQSHKRLSMVEKNGIKTLVGLGLTGKQAHIYLSLMYTGYTKAKTIAGKTHALPKNKNRTF